MTRKLSPPAGLEVLSFEADGEHIVFAVPLPDWQVPPELTRAEGEVALAVLSGMSAAEIAKLRGTSIRTVANQMASIYQKTGVGSRTALAIRCLRVDRE